MPGPTLAQWSAAHAATVTAPARAAAAPAPAETPAELASFSEIRAWADGDRVLAVATGRQTDGRLVLATGGRNDYAVRIWDPQTGELLSTLTGHTGDVSCVAWGYWPDQRPVLASASHDGTVRIWDPGAGHELHSLTGHGLRALSAAWGYLAGGQPQLATSGDGGNIRIWDPVSGASLHEFTVRSQYVHGTAWARQSDGLGPLAVAGTERIVSVWTPDISPGQPLATRAERRRVWNVAWGQQPDGRLLLATSSPDGGVRVWTEDGESTGPALPREAEWTLAMAWAPLTDGRLVLATTSPDSLDLWDGRALRPLHHQPLNTDGTGLHALDWGVTAEGRLLLAAASSGGQIHVWDVVLDPPVKAASAASDKGAGDKAGQGTAAAAPRPRPGSAPLSARAAGELAGWLLRLGAGGLWVPLGLLADLVALTGPADLIAPEGAKRSPSALTDRRLAALADEPGIARLRALGWAPAARVAFAALLASGLGIAERYTPPADTAPDTLRDALSNALAERAGPAQAAPVPVAELRVAATQITERTIALLRILGPAACAADPMKPVRLAHRIPQLPDLTPREQRLLASAGGRRPAARPAAADTLRYSPGTAGVARTGPLTRLLPTQLAFPRELMTISLAGHQLLYRQHNAPTPPAPQPVTIVLDTTPPTIGPAGHALRLAAHLITTTLWDLDRRPHLITLTAPGTLTELRVTSDLVDIWASSTLSDPGPALTAALATAAEVAQPVLLCTHHHTARGSYTPAPATRLLTAHHPPEQAPPAPASPWHQHLPPSPTRTQLTAVIARAIAPHGEDGG